MHWRCRTCGADNRIDEAAVEYECENCQAKFSLVRVKVIEPDRDQAAADPLADQ